MDLEGFMKYIVWIVFFGIALVGLFFMLKKLGVMQ